MSAPAPSGKTLAAEATEGSTERSTWKPYVIGFLIGAVVLTVLPFVQRRFLKAPPPIRTVTAWSAPALSGQPVSSEVLAGHVSLLTIEADPCDSTCLQRQREFGAMSAHLDDLQGTTLVTLAAAPAQAELHEIITTAPANWRFGAPPASLLLELQDALDTFTGERRADVLRAHAIVLLDQNGAVRGFWKSDVEGRGNAINAARLLARHGPTP